MTIPPFHLAFPVDDLVEARRFYGEVLGCPEGRHSDQWVDFNFFGHQIVTHLSPPRESADAVTNQVDGHGVPVPHFGVVLPIAEWQELADRLTASGMEFALEPTIRFKGEVGEQATMFFRDPAGNALEVKAMADPGRLFAQD